MNVEDDGLHGAVNVKISLFNTTVCHGLRLIKQDDYFWVDFDHF